MGTKSSQPPLKDSSSSSWVIYNSPADGEAPLKLLTDVERNNHDDDEAAGLLGADELFSAASEGRVDLVSRILQVFPDLIHIRDPIGNTVFHVAAQSGHVYTLKELRYLDNTTTTPTFMLGNTRGDTAVHLAIKNGHQEAAQVLVLYHPEAMKVKNDEGVTPSDLARKAGYGFKSVLAGFVDIEQRLATADLEGEDNNVREFFKLLLAIEKDQRNKVLEILGANQGLLRRELGGTKVTALHTAAKHGRSEILRDMIGLILTSTRSSGEELTKRLLVDGNEDGDTPLHLAIDGGHEETALDLIQAAPKAAYLANNKGVSPLYLLVKAGCVEIVRKVFELKPLASLCQSRQQIILGNKVASLGRAAVDSRNLGMLRAVLEHVPTLIDSTDKKGWRLLSHAAYKGYLDEVRYLLENFSDSVKKCDQDGSFPVHKVVGGGHVRVMKEFISRCPQTISDIDRNRQSILHIAARTGRVDVLNYLTKEAETKKLFNLKDRDGKTFKDLIKELKG